MVSLTNSENHDPNYLAAIVELGEIKDHPNAQRLQLTEVFGNTIVVGKDSYQKGDKVIYFPVESCLLAEFLSWANLFDRAELNADEKTKGFFSPKGCRVKAVNLRSIPSQGFLFPVKEFAEFCMADERDFPVGTSFDTVDGKQISKKYIRPAEGGVSTQPVKKIKVPKALDKIIGILPRPIRTRVYPFVNKIYSSDSGIKSRIVDGQFKFHYKTEHLGRNVFLVKPEDDITITSKVHGTSAIYANLLVSRKQTTLEKIFGKTPKPKHTFLYSSRSVLKNRGDGKFTEDVWGRNAEKIHKLIPPGFTVYGEIVGWASPGKMVQAGYNYGIKQGESEFWVYRITHVNEAGETDEFSWSDIETWCRSAGVPTVPVYYRGKAKDLFPTIPQDENWREAFLVELKAKYLDKPCEFHNTGVINEGIVVKLNDKESKTALKFKSPKFVEKETESRDKGEENIEEES